MTTAEIIEQHLGPNWWEREHDGTALAALLDRIQDSGGDLKASVEIVRKETYNRARGKSLYTSLQSMNFRSTLTCLASKLEAFRGRQLTEGEQESAVNPEILPPT